MASVQQQQAPTPLAGVQTEGAKLLWHVCHQCNIVTSQLNAYLSLETLQRETLASGLIVPVPHLPQLTAQAVMLTDAAKNLDAAAGLLARTPLDKPYNRGSAYQSLFDAVKLLVGTAPLVKQGVLNAEERRVIRQRYDEAVELCYGSPSKGVRGWKECWDEVFRNKGFTG
ncbi:hypothetical protein KC338_g4610 [Hortaea werneckii]|nr:hypothetical protein KC338_g4610 [Hortaea werneckii]KAI7356068.1 hypothetical protein KC320_g2460 [Hortaea werneckii]